MILFYFPEDVWFDFDGGLRGVFRGYRPPPSMPLSRLDHKRIYVGVREGYESMIRTCRDAGLPPPVWIDVDPCKELRRFPLSVSDALRKRGFPKDRPSRICLINGGGGGLGDGILFAPALEILEETIATISRFPPRLDVFSGFQKRTSSVLAGIHGVRVKMLPVSLWDVLQYDFFLDFSGVLEDVAFQRLHMTDFVLERMGIDYRKIPPERKEPLVRVVPPDDGFVSAVVDLARARSGGRPLVALVHKASAPARSMPEKAAAEVVSILHDHGYMPVIIMSSSKDSREFLQRNGISKKALDLSPLSEGFLDFIYLLSLMDAIVSVDTSAVHIGAGLRIPTVGVFNAIKKELRIEYSPSVKGLQVVYSGRSCKAPCGLSKIKAYIDIKLHKAPVSRRLLFDYPCDESIDIDNFFDEAREAIFHIENSLPSEDVPGEIEKKHREWQEVLRGLIAPCWDSFDPEEVLVSLRSAEQRRASLLFEATCPVCNAPGPHPRVDRFRGMDRLRCDTCGAVFFPAAMELQEAFPVEPGQEEPFPCDHPELEKISRYLSAMEEVLSVGICDCPTGEGGAASGVVPEEIPGSSFRSGGLDVLITRGCLDGVLDPLETARRLLQRLGDRGIWIFGITNPRRIGREAAKAYLSVKRPSPLWSGKTLNVFLDRLGLTPVFKRSTPVTWSDLHDLIGFLPPFNIKPPALKNVTIQLTGEELDQTLASHFQPFLNEVRGQGRFLIVGCTRRRVSP